MEMIKPLQIIVQTSVGYIFLQKLMFIHEKWLWSPSKQRSEHEQFSIFFYLRLLLLSLGPIPGPDCFAFTNIIDCLFMNCELGTSSSSCIPSASSSVFKDLRFLLSSSSLKLTILQLQQHWHGNWCCIYGICGLDHWMLKLFDLGQDDRSQMKIMLGEAIQKNVHE